MINRIKRELVQDDKSCKLTESEIDNYFNQIYARDETGCYKYLKLQDYKGVISYIGKKDSDLEIDEIVRLKQSATKFYELFNKLTLNDVGSIKYVGELLKIRFTEIIFYTTKMDNDLLYISVPVRGGDSVIINPDTKKLLYANSSVNPDRHLQEFLNGRRTDEKNFY